MKRFYFSIVILGLLVLTPELGVSDATQVVSVDEVIDPSFNLSDLKGGSFCNVSDVDVCIVTQSDEDCAKLGGSLIVSCNQTDQYTEDENNNGESCLVKEQEPVYCYGF